jgi:hypothetical protein
MSNPAPSPSLGAAVEAAYRVIDSEPSPTPDTGSTKCPVCGDSEPHHHSVSWVHRQRVIEAVVRPAFHAWLLGSEIPRQFQQYFMVYSGPPERLIERRPNAPCDPVNDGYINHQIGLLWRVWLLAWEKSKDDPAPLEWRAAEPSSPPIEPAPTFTHELKVWPEYFAALLSGEKTFEFRKDDREPRFAVGDVLRLREWLPNEAAAFPCGMYSGAELFRRVRYVARSSPLIPDGFCCMSLGEFTVSGASTPDHDPIAQSLRLSDRIVAALEKELASLRAELSQARALTEKERDTLRAELLKTQPAGAE